MISKSLTTRQVARLCRVSDATVKRWEDAGLIKSERTSGGHRRFQPEEIVRFQREQNLGLKHRHGDESVVRTRTRSAANGDDSDSSFFHSLIAGAETEAANTLITAHLHGSAPSDIFDNLISPAMKRIGELWYKGDLSVAHEHLATRTAQYAIHTLRRTLSVPEMSGELAMCCGIEGDFHELPTYMAQITIENEGWEVLSFGSNMPLHSMTEEILRHSPEIICISATLIPDIERISRDYKQFRERIEKLKIPVIIGGRAFSDEQIRSRFPAEFHAESFNQVAEFLKNIVRE